MRISSPVARSVTIGRADWAVRVPCSSSLPLHPTYLLKSPTSSLPFSRTFYTKPLKVVHTLSATPDVTCTTFKWFVR
jgi:hypothetical protein